MSEYIGKYISFTQTNIDIMDDLIKNKPGINNYADAFRFAILSLEDDLNSVSNIKMKNINAMSKNIDILTEMVAGGFHEADVKANGRAEDTYIYADSKKNVANNIQRSTTI
ncbi:hypothetical protein ACWF7H_03085 [Peribacillus butanolivorans]|uniref:hypothetical protein n=1 Tax=Peribacillus butanolivorans TaxID=421767 RepID=UPI0036C80B58